MKHNSNGQVQYSSLSYDISSPYLKGKKKIIKQTNPKKYHKVFHISAANPLVSGSDI